MNITRTRSAVAQQPPAQTQPQPPAQQQPPAQEQPSPQDKFYSSFSGALETSVPIATGAAFTGLGLTAGFFAGTALGAIVGGAGGATIGAFAGGVGGAVLGYKGGASLGRFALETGGKMGEVHNTENPMKGKAIGQAVAASALTFITGTPVMTAAVVGGSALYAAHQS